MTNKYRLIINKNKLLLEDTAKSVSGEQIGKLISGPLEATFKFSETLIGDYINLMTYGISSIATMFADKKIKDAVESRYETNRKSIFSKYESTIKEIGLKSGYEQAMFLFSPSVFVASKVNERIKSKSSIVGEKLTEFVDDPIGFVIDFIPNLKDSLIKGGKKKLIDEHFESVLKPTDRAVKELMKVIHNAGPDELKRLLSSNEITDDQKNTIRSVLSYYSDIIKDEKINSSYSLLIGKNLVLEEKKTEEKDVLEAVDKLNKLIEETINNITNEIKKENLIQPIIEEQDVEEMIEKMTVSCLEPTNYYALVTETCTLFTDFLEVLGKSLESNGQIPKISGLEQRLEALSKEVDEKFFDNYKKGVMTITNFAELYNKAQNAEAVKFILDKAEFFKLIEGISQQLKSSKNYLNKDIRNSFTKFSEFLELSSISDKSNKNSELVENGLSKVGETINNINKLIPRLDDLAKYFSNVKSSQEQVNNDSKQ